MEFSTCAVVIIYNMNIVDSETYQTLKMQTNPHFNILFIDNSTVSTTNEEYAKKHVLNYISMDGNAGISKAYNRGIAYLKDRADYLVWLDDDTQLPVTFMEALLKVQHTNADVYLPIVKSQGTLISPSRPREWHKCFRNIEAIQRALPNVTAINSGMCVKMAVFQNFSYDERIFLDYIDHVFMHYIRTNKARIELVPIEVQQNFSMDNKGDDLSVQKRFDIFLKDVAIAHEKRRVKGFFVRLKYGVRIGLTQKNIQYAWNALFGKSFN